MSSVTESIHRFLGLPRGRRPPESRRNAVLATETLLVTAHGVAVPSQAGFPHHLRYCGYSESSPDVLIPYVVVEGQPKHPPEHLHFHCVEGQLMFLGRGPKFSAIEGNWANYGLVDLCLEIFWHFLSTQDSGDLSPLEPHRGDSCSCVGDGVAVWLDQVPEVFEFGCRLQLLAVNADGAIGYRPQQDNTKMALFYQQYCCLQFGSSYWIDKGSLNVILWNKTYFIGELMSKQITKTELCVPI